MAKIIFLLTFSMVFGIILGMFFVQALDVSITIPDKYQTVTAGDTLNFQIQIENIAEAGRKDISLEYYIKKGDIIINYKKEIKAVETQASFLSTIQVPEETLPGVYDLVVNINSNKTATSMFRVKSSEIGQIRNYLILLTAAVFIVGILITWELHKLRRTEEGSSRKKKK